MNSNSVELCVHYFKNKKGFERAFLEMKKKWQSYGKVAGKIKIPNATEEEKKELEHFFASNIGIRILSSLFQNLRKH